MLDLFSDEVDPNIDPSANLLPQDGTVNYYGRVMSWAEADRYLQVLLDTIEWRNDEAVIFGQRIETKRKVAWYGETAFEYTYSNMTKTALPWTAELLALKTLVEAQTGETYNSCLLNLYHNGTEGMAWHSDGERDLQENGAIASLSLGAERNFAFKHKQTKQRISLLLQHGSLLVMRGTTQRYWLHRLPPTAIPHPARVNLTFRTIVHEDATYSP
jgi:alkylated DNA repair dioxygenase AlkB